MDNKRLFKSITGTVFLAVAPGAMMVTGLAQKSGTAAKGGSLRIERPERSSKPMNAPMYYRRVVRVLNLDFAELEELYLDARQKGNVRLKFETVIKASLATERRSTNELSDDAQKVVDALSSTKNNLAAALQRVFSLSEQEAKSEEAAVTTQYKTAEREAARLDK